MNTSKAVERMFVQLVKLGFYTDMKEVIDAYTISNSKRRFIIDNRITLVQYEKKIAKAWKCTSQNVQITERVLCKDCGDYNSACEGCSHKEVLVDGVDVLDCFGFILAYDKIECAACKDFAMCGKEVDIRREIKIPEEVVDTPLAVELPTLAVELPIVDTSLLDIINQEEQKEVTALDNLILLEPTSDNTLQYAQELAITPAICTEPLTISKNQISAVQSKFEGQIVDSNLSLMPIQEPTIVEHKKTQKLGTARKFIINELKQNYWNIDELQKVVIANYKMAVCSLESVIYWANSFGILEKREDGYIKLKSF